MFENCDLADEKRPTPKGKRLLHDVQSLPLLLHLAKRSAFYPVVSPRTLHELEKSFGHHALAWAKKMVRWSLQNIKDAGEGEREGILYAKSEMIANSEFLQFVPQDMDRLLVADALCLGCDGFLTTDYKTILRYEGKLRRSVGLAAVSPSKYQEIFQKFEALYL